MLSATLLPTLQACDHFIHEGNIPEPQGHLCIRHDVSVHPHTPKFWAQAASVVASGEGDCVPRCLQGIVPHVVAAGKAVALLRAHRQSSASVAKALHQSSAHADISHRCLLLPMHCTCARSTFALLLGQLPTRAECAHTLCALLACQPSLQPAAL